MRPLAAEEIVGLEAYGKLREAYRRQVIAYKRHRRMAVGEQISVVFEDRETVRFQVQEMLWVERTDDPRAVAHEVEVYNELVPGEGELSATLLIEITEPERIKPELERLVGIEDQVFLVLGEGAQEIRIGARFDPRQLDQDRVSAVHYVRFAVPERARRALADPGVRARLRITHSAYRREDEIPPRLREQLLADLAAEPEPLLRPGAPPPARDELLFQMGGARVLRPAQPLHPGHLVVEPAEAGLLLEAGAEAWEALWPALQRAAREVVRAHGAAQITAEAGEGAPLRFHVCARRES